MLRTITSARTMGTLHLGGERVRNQQLLAACTLPLGPIPALNILNSDVRLPSPAVLAALDGAFFGTTFAHLFFMTFDRLVPEPAQTHYTPLIFGFKIHK